jgi:hypothetical protein
MVLGAISASTNALYTDTFTGDGTETDYTLGITPVDLNAIEVYLNGLYQNVATLTLAANVVTFATPPPSGVIIEIRSVGFLNSGGTLAPATLIGGTGIEVITNSPNNFTINNTLVDVTVSFNAPTGQSLTYTTPGASSGQAGSIFPTTTFTVTGGSNTLSGTAVITGLPAGITSTQSYNNTNPGNILTITLSGVYPSTNSIGTNLVISNLTVTFPPLTVEYLVVAGGGGGGPTHGGGGGAGGLRTSYGSTTGGGGTSESTLSLNIATNYSVSVGSGGSGGSNAANGIDSTFSSITSTGGGTGGTYPSPFPGNTGGSGGGAGGSTSSGSISGGSAVTSPVTQGYAGGASNLFSAGAYASGGGGGANAIGASTVNSHQGGNGGAGLAVNILNSTNAGTASIGEVSGSDVYFAGGGGGCGDQNTTGGAGGTGGTGGGGNGDYIYTDSGDSGIANTGGGGGGSRSLSSGGTGGGAGGSGVVILRYPNPYTVSVGAGITQSSGSPFTEGTDKVSVFTGGTGNITFN